ncbi:hypothetical protein [Bradyrhizobium sp. USDA 4454]
MPITVLIGAGLPGATTIRATFRVATRGSAQRWMDSIQPTGCSPIEIRSAFTRGK